MNGDLGSRRKRTKFPGAAKAKEMLDNPPHGQPLTQPQHNLFEGLAHGWKPNGRKSRRRKA